MTPKDPRFDVMKGTLLLPLQHTDLVPRLEMFRAEAELRNLTAKNEFHITVIGYRAGSILAALMRQLKEPEYARAKDAFLKLALETDWSFSFENQAAYAVEKEYNNRSAKEVRHSILQLVHMPGIEEFYRRLNSAIPTPLQLPFPHVTLYTSSTNPETQSAGIGIDSETELATLHPQRLL